MRSHPGSHPCWRTSVECISGEPWELWGAMSQPVTLPGSASVRGMVWVCSERTQVVTPVGSTDGLLCPQLFGDVCYNCSHVIEGDGEASVPKLFPPLLSPSLFPGRVVRGGRGWGDGVGGWRRGCPIAGPSGSGLHGWACSWFGWGLLIPHLAS